MIAAALRGNPFGWLVVAICFAALMAVYATRSSIGLMMSFWEVEPGWSRGRDIRPEDVEATIYSAMGIDWTTVRYDDPLGRGFYYIPVADDDVYAPIEEAFA